MFLELGVLKICSKYRRTPMPKCDFNKAEIAKLKLLLQACLLRFICLLKVTKTGTKCKHLRSIRCVRSVRIWSYSGLYFPTFGLDMERYGVEKCSKIRTRTTPNKGTFHAVITLPFVTHSDIFQIERIYWNIRIKASKLACIVD